MILSSERKNVLMVGCFDTKAEDFGYMHACLVEFGAKVISINTGVRGSTSDFAVSIEADEVAEAAGIDLQSLRNSDDRGLVVDKMSIGAGMIASKLYARGDIDGVIGMGGGGGTYIAISAMRHLPVGLPKFCLSTLASKDLSEQIGAKDITMMPSIVDVAGLNKISRILIRQAAGAICGMVQAGRPESQTESKGTIAISMFGNTTECVEMCSKILKEQGYQVLAFHAVGVGGMSMESLIRDGYIDAVMDLTTTELADELCVGICSAGAERLTAAGEVGIPQVVAPGCLDMVNFGSLASVPERYSSRHLYSWAPDVTLMRTNADENRQLGLEIAQKLNKAKGHVSVLLPMQGLSRVSAKGGVFHDPSIDQVLFDTIRDGLEDHVSLREVDATINDRVFAEAAVRELLGMLGENQ